MSLFASFANDDDSSGSLWGNDSGGGLFSNPLQDLLDSGNFTLKDVLTQQTLIQEVRNLNESLIKEFFINIFPVFPSKYLYLFSHLHMN